MEEIHGIISNLPFIHSVHVALLAAMDNRFQQFQDNPNIPLGDLFLKSVLHSFE